MKETAQCPKCDGSGYINAFSHYAQGVCFCCKGAGTIAVDLEAKKADLSDEIRNKAEWLLASTEADYEGLSYEKLMKIRNFAHGGWGIDAAYPNLLNHWREVGEPAFQAAQERRLEAFYAGESGIGIQP